MGGILESATKVLSEKAEQLAPKALASAKEFFGTVADKYLKQGSAVVSKLGTEGELIVNSLNSYAEKHRALFGEYSATRDKLLQNLGKAEPDVLHNYEAYFTKKKPITNPHLQQLVDFDRMTNLAAYKKAAQAKVPVGPLNPDDWSRIWPRDMMEGSGRDKAIKHLIQTGQAKNEHEAERTLDFLAGRSKGVKDHNLVSGRKVDLPGYRMDISAPSESMQKKLKSIAFAETFGPKGEMLDQLLSGVRNKSKYSNYKLADKYVDVFMKKQGANYRPVSGPEQTLNSVMAARFLGRTSIKHLEKPLNVVIFSGRTGPALKALRDMVVDYGNSNEFAIRSGAAMSQTLDQVRTMFDSEMGRGGSWVTKLTGLNSLDRLSRVFAANSGKHLAMELADEYAESKSPKVAAKLGQLGIDADRSLGGLTEQELLRAGQRTSDVTQFVYNPSSLPMAWRDHPLSRMLTQFKPYPYIMGNFLIEHAIKPAMKGDVKPLMYYTLLFPAVGEVVGDLSNLTAYGDLSRRPDKKYIVDRIVDNVGYMAGFGLLYDAMMALSSPGDTAAWHLIASPLLSEVVDLSGLPKSQHPAADLMRQVPIVGPLLSTKSKSKPTSKPPKGSLRSGVLTRHLGLEGILGE